MLSNERTKELIEDIDKNSPWIIDATRDVVEHLNDEGYLREPEVEVPYLDIKEGDRIHLVYKTGDTDGPTEEIYVADHDRDYNGWSMPDEDFTFFLIDRPEPPKPGVEDLAPGVRFTARFLGGVLREYVSLKGGTVLALASGEALELVYGLGRLDAAKIIKNSSENVDVSVSGIAFEEYLKAIDSEGI